MKYQNENDFAKANMFGKGEPNVNFAQYFIGESFLNPQTDFQNGEFPLFNGGCYHSHSILRELAQSVGGFQPRKRSIYVRGLNIWQ